jgi:fructose-bisphosphate aldolase class I
MVKNGLKGPMADPETVATLTVTALKRTVPSAMPGIFFLSGEMPLDVDNEETASIHLSTMNKLFAGSLPWHLSFSFGKALQKTAIVTWATTQSDEKTQQALAARAKANHEAVMGKYVAGSCASVGVEGAAAQAAGGY